MQDNEIKIRFYQDRQRAIDLARTFGELAAMITEARVDDPDGLPAMIDRRVGAMPLCWGEEARAMAHAPDPWVIAARHGAEPVGRVGQTVRVDRSVHDPMAGAGDLAEVVREGIMYAPERLVIDKARVY